MCFSEPKKLKAYVLNRIEKKTQVLYEEYLDIGR